MQYEGMNQDQIINAVQAMLDRPIVLVGMMGAGKSHLGRQLASSLTLDFIDTDSVIEEKAGASVAEIFTRDGEAKFREAEKNTILELLERAPCVIATGGGAVMNEQSRQAMRERGVTIWLNADMPTLLERTAKNQSRPLLQEDDPESVLKGLLEKRRSLYEQAHIAVNTSNDASQCAVDEAIKSLYDALKNDTLGGL